MGGGAEGTVQSKVCAFKWQDKGIDNVETGLGRLKRWNVNVSRKLTSAGTDTEYKVAHARINVTTREVVTSLGTCRFQVQTYFLLVFMWLRVLLPLAGVLKVCGCLPSYCTSLYARLGQGIPSRSICSSLKKWMSTVWQKKQEGKIKALTRFLLVRQLLELK